MIRAVFLDIYEAYFSRVYNYISYRISDHGDVDDLVSQVFTRAIAKYDSYDAERGCIEAWIIGIARNALIDYFRQKGKGEFANLESIKDTLTGGPPPEEIIVMRENNRCLIKALQSLSERERNVVAMKYGAELSNRQIARQLNLSVSNIGVILFRSLRKLRKQLDREV